MKGMDLLKIANEGDIVKISDRSDDPKAHYFCRCYDLGKPSVMLQICRPKMLITTHGDGRDEWEIIWRITNPHDFKEVVEELGFTACKDCINLINRCH